MQLVEVVAHPNASAQSLARARHFVGQLSRLPAPVSSAPGFLVNRTLTLYIAEALLMLDEGLAAVSIDQVALDFGMPMCPIRSQEHTSELQSSGYIICCLQIKK